MRTKMPVAFIVAVLGVWSVQMAARDVSLVGAARVNDAAGVDRALKAGAEINEAEGDGMTALHWAAANGNVDVVDRVLRAGADVQRKTRVGAFTPLLIASRYGHAPVVERLLAAGSDPNVANVNGTTALMFAASAGGEAVKSLLAHGASVNARESARHQTALMFAAANDRADAVRVLIAHGADANARAKTVDLTPFLDEEAAKRKRVSLYKGYSGDSRWGPVLAPGTEEKAEGEFVDKRPGIERRLTFTENVGGWGGMAALHLAIRQGAFDAARALLEGGADLNLPSVGNQATPLATAALNGQFDIAMYLLEQGADPNLQEDNGETPLYAVINLQWASKNFFPHPRAHLQQRAGYLELMKALLDKGADPNLRTTRKVWTSNFADYDTSGVDDAGATPFWRAAYASDVEAMKLLLAHGADPTIPTARTFGRATLENGEERSKSGGPAVPLGGPSIPPLLAAAGPGYAVSSAANVHRVAATGMLAAVRFLVEQVHADVNSRDDDGNTPLHNAASRGDNEMIQYLIANGADPHAVNKNGQTTVDVANGPSSRTLPYPETIALLEKLGVKNNHRCMTC